MLYNYSCYSRLHRDRHTPACLLLPCAETRGIQISANLLDCPIKSGNDRLSVTNCSYKSKNFGTTTVESKR